MATKRLYVGNIPFDATDDDVRRFFHPIPVSNIRLIADRDSGRPRGFGFVEVESDSHASSALALDGAQMGGRSITVSEARLKERGGGKNRQPEEYDIRGGQRGKYADRYAASKAKEDAERGRRGGGNRRD